MLRPFQVLVCLCALFVIGGCKEEVKEIPAEKTTSTPTVSEQEKNALLEGENKHQKDALEKRKDQNKTKKTK